MRVQIERVSRATDNERSVYVFANDIAHDTATIDEWIEMLRRAKSWLKAKDKGAK